MTENNYWRKCASCKKEISFQSIYQRCSVSTCRKHVYCSVNCWEVHLPVLNHKSAWAEEEVSPRKSEVVDSGKRRKLVSPPKASNESQSAAEYSSAPSSAKNVSRDILIVASKLKSYVKEKHGLNTSGNVLEALSDIVRHHADKAVQNALNEGRKTLMDRDF